MPTVKEDAEEEEEEEDDDPNVKDRDAQGFTELHKLASQPGIDMKSLLDLGYSIADRDINGRTVRDVAEEAGQTETLQAIGICALRDHHFYKCISKTYCKKHKTNSTIAIMKTLL